MSVNAKYKNVTYETINAKLFLENIWKIRDNVLKGMKIGQKNVLAVYAVAVSVHTGIWFYLSFLPFFKWFCPRGIYTAFLCISEESTAK